MRIKLSTDWKNGNWIHRKSGKKKTKKKKKKRGERSPFISPEPNQLLALKILFSCCCSAVMVVMAMQLSCLSIEWTQHTLLDSQTLRCHAHTFSFQCNRSIVFLSHGQLTSVTKLLQIYNDNNDKYYIFNLWSELCWTTMNNNSECQEHNYRENKFNQFTHKRALSLSHTLYLGHWSPERVKVAKWIFDSF